MMDRAGGQEFRRLIGAATAWLEYNAAAVNALNVFPVPDGDTGTNMLLTARAAYDEVAASDSDNAGEIAQKIYRGAQFGSRGNSGVILSQLLRGYAAALRDKAVFTGRDFADALRQAAVFAYQGVTKPVEGTVLTVAREAGEAAMLLDESADLKTVIERAVSAARDSVERTPTLLKVLRDAGVVDAGGQGYFVFLEGMQRYLQGATTYVVPGATAGSVEAVAPAFSMDFVGEAEDELGGYGYCTEFIVEGELDFDEFRTDMLKLGTSAVVVGDDVMIKVHIHTPDPGAALTYATQHGSLLKVKIDNMDRQHQDFAGAPPKPAAAKAPARPQAARVEALHNFSVVVVAPGAGFGEIFSSMGVSEIVTGGQTMNPSVQDLLVAIQAAPAQEVIVLPNNKNIIPAARQAAELADKTVHVVPSRSIPEGISAVLAMRYEAGLDANVAAMTAALSQVQTVELAEAVRSVTIGDLNVEAGHFIGVLNDDVVASGEDIVQVTLAVFERLGIEDYEVLSAYYGQGITEAEARAFAEQVSAGLKEQYDLPVDVIAPSDTEAARRESKFGTLRLELHSGGQPHYAYIMSVE